MQKEKIALIALVIIIVAALSVFVTATTTTIFKDLFKEKLVLAAEDCADVNFIGRYASNNTIFDTSYKFAQNKSGGTPLKIFLKTFPQEASWKPGYSNDTIEGLAEGLVGMTEGQTKIIGPIPPEKAYGTKKLTEGSIFTTQYLAFGMNQTVEVTNYTSDNISFKWLPMNNFTSNFSMPQLVIKNLQSENESEMVIYPPPYYIWKNSSSITNITNTTVTVRTTPTKTMNLTEIVTDVRDGEKQMLIFPNATTASWTNTTITVICSPQKGWNYTFQTQGYTGMVNISVHINNITGDKINVTITNDQSPEPTYLDIYKTLTFNRTYTLPRLYKDIPTMYLDYFYKDDITKAGYSLNPLAGETLIYEVTVEKIYKHT